MNGRRPTNGVLTEAALIIYCECMIDDDFQLRIEEFMARHRLTPTTFGLWAMNDSRFVFDLRNGRACFGKTMRRVLVFMNDYDAKRGNRSALVSPPAIEAVRRRAETLKLVATARIIEQARLVPSSSDCDADCPAHAVAEKRAD